VSTREEMLQRVRRALGRPPEGGVEALGATDPAPTEAGVPPLAVQEILPKFEAEWEKVGGSAYRAAHLGDLERIVQMILESAQATSVVLSRNPLLGKLGLEERLRAWGKSVTAWPKLSPAAADETTPRREFAAASFSADVGITGVDFVLAETGSVVLSSRTEGSQLASLAPPIHVAFYRRDQLVGSLDEVLEKLSLSHQPNGLAPGRSVVLITGPSRTADIEQILVRGVHGPREVHAILVEESCLAEAGGGPPPARERT
jgi:L-lactate dehydrogenase complex protein LldG